MACNTPAYRQASACFNPTLGIGFIQELGCVKQRLALRFSGPDVEQNVKQTAGKIAAEVAARASGTTAPPK